MKKIFLFLSFVSLLSCSKGDLNDNLYDGTGGISAAVNGGVLNPPKYRSRCEFGTADNGSKSLTVSFVQDLNNGTNSMTVRATAINLPEGNLSGKTFPLRTGEGEGSFIFNYDEPYVTDDTHKGYLHVSFHNHELRFITGIFSYDCVNPDGKVIHITFGKYDMYY
jgi:hypothetical protein